MRFVIRCAEELAAPHKSGQRLLLHGLPIRVARVRFQGLLQPALVELRAARGVREEGGEEDEEDAGVPLDVDVFELVSCGFGFTRVTENAESLRK